MDKLIYSYNFYILNQKLKFYISYSYKLFVNLNKVTIQCGLIEKTILSFIKQIEGAEGIKITNSKNITLSDFTIEDSKGDLIKVEDTKDIKFNRIKLNLYASLIINFKVL